MGLFNRMFSNRMVEYRIILATYMDQFQADSIGLIQREVMASRHIDELRAYNRSVLPESIQKSLPGMLCRSWVILDVMKDMTENDILVYSDAANIIHEESVWKKKRSTISKSSALFLFNAESQCDIKNKFIEDDYYRAKIYPTLKLNGGLFFLKKSACDLIHEWNDRVRCLSCSATNPEVLDHIELSKVINNHLDNDRIKIFIQD